MKTLLVVSLFLIAACFIPDAHSVKQVEELKGSGKQNEIPLLDNRFRIDDKIDEIKLIFFRRPGSPAVILVRPDGTKYFATNAVKNTSLDWYDELNYDLVVIRNPMPGPWQVIGQIMPQSRIVVIGELSLKVDPLPKILFQGETVKVTGEILNDGEPIRANLFKDAVSLNVSFVSTNNENFENFGAGIQQVTEFKDDGYGFDESAKDGVFTGEFTLNFTPGEWRPEFYITTDVLERRVVQDTIVVHEPPFSFTSVEATDEGDDHRITINIDEKLLKPETVIMQGKIYYPNNEEQVFYLDTNNTAVRELALQDYGWGRYNIEISVFGSTVNDREFMATLPTYLFEIERPIEVIPEIPKASLIKEENIPEPVIKPKVMATGVMVSLIIGGNLAILFIGWLCIRVFVQNKPIKLKLNFAFLKKKKATEAKKSEQQKTTDAENGSKNDKTGEILNLSMSDD